MHDEAPSFATAWKLLGTTIGGAVYEVSPDTLAVVPRQDSHDTEVTARAQVTFLNAHLRAGGRRAALLIMFDPLLSQDRAARSVYQTEPDVSHISCVALIGGSVFGRAVGSVFLGLARTLVPTRMFATLEQGVDWIAEMKARASGSP